MDLKNIFNDIISDYDFARPGYLKELFKDIVEFSSIKPGGSVLEIGAGPGQATEYFAHNGYDITSLELGDNQVQYLAEKFSARRNFKPLCSSFEDYNCKDEAFDLIFSATAFHWIEPDVGYPKAYNLLKKGGVLAVFWHMYSIIRKETEEFIELSKIFQKYAPELDSFLSREEAEALHIQRLSEIQTKGLFSSPVYKVYKWEDEYTAERYVKLLNSYSDIHKVDEETRLAILQSIADYIESRNGKIIVPQEVWMYMAKK